MTEALIDSRMAGPDMCVTGALIDRNAAATPDKVYAVFPDGSEWTYAELRQRVRQTAVGLERLGVKQGDHVVCWLPNGQDALRVWFAINYLGAVYVPINTSYRGGILAHVVANSDARLIVAHADLAPRLADIDRAALTSIVVLGGTLESCADLQVHPAAALSPADGEPTPPPRTVMPWDTQSIIYTSGTTGPSKGVLSSYLHAYTTGAAYSSLPGEDGKPLITSDDRYLLSLPMFHVGGTLPAHIMLAMGGSISIVDSFNTKTFWKTIRDTRVTFAILLGVMAQFLAKQDPVPEEVDNPLRTVMLVPFDFDPTAFRARFGVQTMTLFNMTEISCPLLAPVHATPLHSPGPPRAGNPRHRRSQPALCRRTGADGWRDRRRFLQPGTAARPEARCTDGHDHGRGRRRPDRDISGILPQQYYGPAAGRQRNSQRPALPQRPRRGPHERGRGRKQVHRIVSRLSQ